MPSCNTYLLTSVSLTLCVGYLFMAAPAKCSHCSLPWMRGISLLPPLPDLQCGIAPLALLRLRSHGSLDVRLVLPATAPGLGLRGVGYLLPAAAPDLRHGVLLSSLPLTSDAGYLLSDAPPDLGCWVAPLSRPP